MRIFQIILVASVAGAALYYGVPHYRNQQVAEACRQVRRFAENFTVEQRRQCNTFEMQQEQAERAALAADQAAAARILEQRR